MKLYFLELLLMFLLQTTETTKTQDYCWRDYDGSLPADAFPANSPDKSKIVYIGQVLHNDKIIPGKIFANDSKIYFEYFNEEYSTDLNIKIFCTKQPEKFEWVSIKNTDIPQLHVEQFIRGGFEPKCSTYIGRVDINGEDNPGKVVCCEDVPDCYGLYTTHNGTGSMHTSFQILRYTEKLGSSTNIDNRNKEDKPQNAKCKKVVINLYN